MSKAKPKKCKIIPLWARNPNKLWCCVHKQTLLYVYEVNNGLLFKCQVYDEQEDAYLRNIGKRI